jgi:hypothetical protein
MCFKPLLPFGYRQVAYLTKTVTTGECYLGSIASSPNGYCIESKCRFDSYASGYCNPLIVTDATVSPNHYCTFLIQYDVANTILVVNKFRGVAYAKIFDGHYYGDIHYIASNYNNSINAIVNGTYISVGYIPTAEYVPPHGFFSVLGNVTGRVEYVKVYEGDSINAPKLHYYIPCVRESDGYCGMYDVVQKVFRKQNQTRFSPGPYV